MTRPRLPRALVASAAALAVVLLPGCASIPTSGSVQAGAEAEEVPDSHDVVGVVSPPQPGATPVQIVRGFLLASERFHQAPASARAYLGKEQRESWSGEAGVVVYAQGSLAEPAVREQAGGDVIVGVEAEQVARIDAGGRYERLDEPETVELGYRVAPDEAGEWRIAEAPTGLVLSEAVVEDVFDPYAVYYVGAGGDVLVPDLRLLPGGENLATLLVRHLLDGPSEWLADGVTNAFPPDTALTVPSVPVVDGVAQVDLDGRVLATDRDARRALSAQLVHTLAQVDDVRAVRITAQDLPLSVPGGRVEQEVDRAWAEFDPAGLSGSALPYAVREGRLGTIEGGTFTPVSGVLGDGTEIVTEPAVSLDRDRVAYLRQAEADAWALVEAPLSATSPPVQIRPPSRQISGPSWDRTGRVWVVDAGVVTVLDPSAGGGPQWDPVAVDVPDGGVVTQVRVARDGTRAALVVQMPEGEDRLYVGVVERDEAARPRSVHNLLRLAADLTVVRDVAWQSPTEVVTVGANAEGPVKPRVVGIDGYASSERHMIDARAVAAAPGPSQPVIVESEGRLKLSRGGEWVDLGEGGQPTYPG